MFKGFINMKIFSNSVSETEKIGKKLASTLKGNEIIEDCHSVCEIWFKKHCCEK